MTFGPLPAARPAARRRHRAARVAGRRDVLALASLLLGYPNDDLSNALPDIDEAVGALPPGPAATDLREFLAWFSTIDPPARCVEYVRTFDHKRRSALYATFAPYGDSRRRGAALAELRQRYHDAGYTESGDELPDYLPTILQFAALAGNEEADDVLAQARPGIVSIGEALDAQHSPYAAVLRAVVRCTPSRQAPPLDETVPEVEGALA